MLITKQSVNLSTLSFLILALTALMANPVHAAGPIAFDSWNESNGNITIACPAGFVCEESVRSNGLLQQMLTDSNGKQFIHQIVIDRNSPGAAMQVESFIQSGNVGQSGIAARQSLVQTGVNSMDMQVALFTGWANQGEAAVDISQTVNSFEINNVGYESTFSLKQNRNSLNKITGYFLDIRQSVTNSTLAGGDTSTTGQDIHTFVTRKAMGDLVSSNGSVSLARSGGGRMGGGGPVGGNLSWNAGDEIQVIWIGQLCEGCQNQGGGMRMGGRGGGSGGNANFSFMQYDKIGDGQSPIATRSYRQTTPINWVTDPFGSEPGL